MIDPISSAVVGSTVGAATNHVVEPHLQKIPYNVKAIAVLGIVLFLFWYYYGKKIVKGKRK